MNAAPIRGRTVAEIAEGTGLARHVVYRATLNGSRSGILPALDSTKRPARYYFNPDILAELAKYEVVRIQEDIKRYSKASIDTATHEVLARLLPHELPTHETVPHELTPPVAMPVAMHSVEPAPRRKELVGMLNKAIESLFENTPEDRCAINIKLLKENRGKSTPEITDVFNALATLYTYYSNNLSKGN